MPGLDPALEAVVLALVQGLRAFDVPFCIIGALALELEAGGGRPAPVVPPRARNLNVADHCVRHAIVNSYSTAS